MTIETVHGVDTPRTLSLPGVRSVLQNLQETGETGVDCAAPKQSGRLQVHMKGSPESFVGVNISRESNNAVITLEEDTIFEAAGIVIEDGQKEIGRVETETPLSKIVLTPDQNESSGFDISVTNLAGESVFLSENDLRVIKSVITKLSVVAEGKTKPKLLETV